MEKSYTKFLNIGPHLVATLILSFFSIYIFKNSFNWAQADDFALVDFYQRIFFDNSISALDTLMVKNGSHPVGLELLAVAYYFEYIRFNFIDIEIISLILSGLAGILLFDLIKNKIKVNHYIAIIFLMALFIHPIQINHFLWPFEIGWFMVTFFLILNTWVIEKFEKAPQLIMILIISSAATLTSGQGSFLWFIAAFQLFLKYPLNKITAIKIVSLILIFIGFSAFLLHGNPEIQDFSQVKYYELLIYIIQLLGGLFGTRNPTLLLIIGLVIFLISSFVLVRTITNRKSAPEIDRLSSTLILSTLTFLIGFAIARYKNGLPWALDRFHFSPFLIPLYSGLLILCFKSYVKHNLLQRLALIFSGSLIFISLLNVSTYARIRLNDQRASREFGMAVLCSKIENPLLINSASGLSNQLPLIDRTKSSLLKICPDTIPAKALELLTLPTFFNDIIEKNKRHKDAILNLWLAYQVHRDLQGAFPITSTETPVNLIHFAAQNAKTGSKYDPELLKAFESDYISIEENLADYQVKQN